MQIVKKIKYKYVDLTCKLYIQKISLIISNIEKKIDEQINKKSRLNRDFLNCNKTYLKTLELD